MVNLQFNELNLTAKSRGIKGYKNMYKDYLIRWRLLSTLNVSGLMKESETMPDPTKINKTIRKIRKENRDEDKILRILRFWSVSEKDRCEPVKTVGAFSNNYIEYESNGDKNKSLSVKDLDKIIPYLSNLINDLKTQE